MVTQQPNLQRTPKFSNFSTERQEAADKPVDSLKSTTNTRDISETDILEDVENASLKSSEGEYKTSAPCVSQQKREAIHRPCGVPVVTGRPRKCNINNLFHISQEASRWIQIMVGRLF